jgi:hypothetical protein
MRVLCALACVTWCACGARSELFVPDAPAPVDASVEPSAPVDASPQTPCTAIEYTSVGARQSPSLVVTGGYVYYVSSSRSVVRFPVEGGTPTTVVSDPNGFDATFVVDETYVWWIVTSNGKNGDTVDWLARAPITGSDAELLQCATSDGCPGTLESFSSIVAQTEASLIVGTAYATNLYVIPKTGGTPVPLVPIATAPTTPYDAVTIVSDQLFWTTSEFVYAATMGAYAQQTNIAQWPTGLASNDGHAYWTLTSHDTSNLVRRDIDGTTTTLFTGSLRGPLAANASFVYGITDAGVSRVPSTGGTSSLILPEVGPKLFVVDDACIYFIDGDAVRRAPG